MEIISIGGVGKSFGAARALEGVTLGIRKGEFFGIVGPDGAGKTTLFRLMATLLVPDAGRISVCGCDTVADYRAIRRRIGYMPGRFSLYPDLSVEENLRFFAAVYGVDAGANLHLVEDIYRSLAPFRGRRAGKLSGGMKQKLALCCALIHAPEVLLLDEPTTGVDPVSRLELFAMLRNLNARHGITVVVATPYRNEVMHCGRIALMEGGRVMDTGRPQDILPPEEPLPPRTAPEGGEAVIEAEGLTKRFGAFTATDHISFKVYRGEIFGFLGANGAGKTTAMRMLCGLSQPSEGRARVAGYDCATQPEEVKRHIGYMSQRFSLYTDLTVGENIEFYGGIYGMSASDIRRERERLLDELGLDADMPVVRLPQGWRQRLAFSVAILHRPEVVFLDEPTGGVDAATRRQFWEMIRETARRGITVFVTTHYMDEAEYCDRVSIMVDGRIAALDTPRRLMEHHRAATMYDVFYGIVRHAVRQ